MGISLYFAYWFLCLVTVKGEHETASVSTELGNITGLLVGDQYRFLGIPYAEPPLGNLRFNPPKPGGMFENLEATAYGAICVQTSFDWDSIGEIIGEEDCLFLNVFTPQIPKPGTHQAHLRPVMFWIHGGDFSVGSSNQYDPSDLVKQDIVVVTFNYRLGAFGFLNFGNKVLSGNMGVRDQIQALTWTKKHIKGFGGDPSKITIFGDSAGGISVHALHLSPLAEGMFVGAIAQSGSMLNIRCIPEISKDWRISVNLSKEFNCSSLLLDLEMLDCLQNLSYENLQRATGGLKMDDYKSNFGQAIFWPSTDEFSSNPVLPIDPLKAVLMGSFNRVPLLTGTVNNGGETAVLFAESLGQNLDEFWRTNAPIILQVSHTCNSSEISEDDKLRADVILNYYTGGSLNLNATRDKWLTMLTDTLFLSSDQQLAELVSRHVNVYNYLYIHQTREPSGPSAKLPPSYSEDISFFFNNTDYKENQTPYDKSMTRIMIKYWANFAKYGTPSPTISDILRSKSYVDQLIAVESAVKHLIKLESTVDQILNNHNETKNLDKNDISKNNHIQLTQWTPYSTERNYMELSAAPQMKKNIHPQRRFFLESLIWTERESLIGKNFLRKVASKPYHGFMVNYFIENLRRNLDQEET